MLELFPEGFEEREGAETLELAAYADGEGAQRLWRAFGEYSWAEVPADWAERWRRFHRPATVGRVWVGPPWESPPAKLVPVVIDPGRAFGTGAHPTTRLCLELVQELPRGPLVDLGCGSGVLAIAAAKLGFHPVAALDHDAVAVETARENAARNGVAVAVSLRDALDEDASGFSVAVANISRTAVERLAERLRAVYLVAAGYLAAEEPALPGYRHLARRTAESWAADLYARE